MAKKHFQLCLAPFHGSCGSVVFMVKTFAVYHNSKVIEMLIQKLFQFILGNDATSNPLH